MSLREKRAGDGEKAKRCKDKPSHEQNPCGWKEAKGSRRRDANANGGCVD
jgi:hypothetical protein